jgi:parallel beta-helix repeat protein
MLRARFYSAFVFVAAIACGDTKSPTSPTAAPDADRAEISAALVPAGGSIQNAIDAAAPGAIIRISAGTYHEALTIVTPRLTLVGLGQVVIENPGTAEDGIVVADAGDGFALVNVTVSGFEENGVKLEHVNGFVLLNVRAENDGEYGIFPVFSSHGVIVHCAASGHSDTGIYVGQSDHIVVADNVASANVNGLEIENSSDVLVANNESFDNVAGILVVLLPGLDVKTSSTILVRGNRVHDNNHPNFATPGEFESFVPTGSGILIVGTDATTVSGNTVTGNQFTGIAVGSSLLLGALAGLPPEAFADIEPNPDRARIVRNVVTGNGGASPIPFLPAVDLLWDGSGTGNCWRGNTFGTSAPATLPACS